MFIEFAVKNYRSIKDSQVFSMVKAKGGELEASNSFQPAPPANISLLRSAAIYGANAAGKSNVVRAIKDMQSIVLYSASAAQEGDDILVTPFRFDEATVSEPTEFEMLFINEGVRYQFGFCANETRVTEEWLIAYPNGRPQRWYSRVYDGGKELAEYKFGDQFTGQKTVWQKATRENALFLSTAIQLNCEQLRPVFNWFKQILHTDGVEGWGLDFTASLCKQPDTKAPVLELLGAADLAIHDIIIDEDRPDLELHYEGTSVNLMKMFSKILKDKPKIITLHKVENDTLIPLEFEEESDGTKKFFSLAGPWLKALERGDVLVIDELHAYLHPKMVQFLVNLFHSNRTNPKHAQLIFTTHETSILNDDIFRRDQIWFCEKQKNQATSLYPLFDFKARKAWENIELGYLSGRYGAVPFIQEYDLELN